MTETELKSKIKKTIEDSAKYWGVPSAGYGIVKDGKIFLAGGYGLRDVEQGLAANADTTYMIGSCTKAFTSAIVAKLVDEGKLDWDTPIREYVPEVRFYDDYTTEHATLRDLLCHRLGMPRHEWSWYNTNFTRDELVANLRYLEPNAPFRTTYQYFNQGYLLAGYIIEHITGRPYAECLKEYIFQPLGMTRSSITKAELENDPNGAKPYINAECFDFVGPYKRCDIYRSVAETSGRSKDDPIAPAGMINSSVNDMLKWVQFHLDMGKINGKEHISAKNMYELHKPQMIEAKPYSAERDGLDPDGDVVHSTCYAFAWNNSIYRGHEVIHHGGNIDGFSALTSFVPDLNLGFVLYVNRGSFQGRYCIEHQVIDAFLGAGDIDWQERYTACMNDAVELMTQQGLSILGEQKQGTAPSHPLKDYAGTYGRKGYENIVITEDNDEMVLHFARMEFAMKHYHYDSFLIFSADPDMGGNVPVVFHTSPTGEVDGLSIQLNYEPGTELVKFEKRN